MSESIHDVLAQANDFELCDGVFLHIHERYGEDIDAASLSESERVILLVWGARGIIDNGGFRYLFEGNVKGDPYFFLTADAFRTIGCERAAEAFRRTLDIFPDGRPQRDIDKRLKHYLSRQTEWPTALDKAFFAAGEECTKCLARYIRAHADALVREKAPAPQAPAAPTLPLPQARGRESVGVEQPAAPSKAARALAALPHWARVAFAARCARLVFPLLSRFWPNTPRRWSNYLLTAIDLAEQCAGEGHAADGLKQAHMHVVMTAGTALTAGGLNPESEPRPANAYDGTMASYVAKASEYAVQTAGASPKESDGPALEARRYARDVAQAAQDEETLQTIKQDLANLRQAAKHGNWTHQTPVPPEIWNML